MNCTICQHYGKCKVFEHSKEYGEHKIWTSMTEWKHGASFIITEDGPTCHEFENKPTEKVENTTDKRIKEYIADQETRVSIIRTDELGYWIYAVQVAGTDFWLASFKRKNDAVKFIEENGLKMAR